MRFHDELVRWCRCAQPPANRFDRSGVEKSKRKTGGPANRKGMPDQDSGSVAYASWFTPVSDQSEGAAARSCGFKKMPGVLVQFVAIYRQIVFGFALGFGFAFGLALDFGSDSSAGEKKALVRGPAFICLAYQP